jgi:hypothetical protein
MTGFPTEIQKPSAVFFEKAPDLHLETYARLDLLLPRADPLSEVRTQTIAEAIALLDAQFPWLRCAGKRSHRRAKAPAYRRVARLVAEFTTHLDELYLEPRQKQRAEAQITALRAELTGDPDLGIVAQAGRSLRNITEAAVGSLIATAAQPGVWHWVEQTMSTLF